MRAHARALARLTANALLTGPWTLEGALERVRELFDARPAWLRKAVERALAAFPEPPRDARDELARFLLADEDFARRLGSPAGVLRAHHVFLGPPAMSGAVPWAVRRLDTLADVSRWLELPGTELDFWADRRAMNARTAERRLHHYRYAWVPKRSGGARLLEAPKQRLKRAQRRILRDILDAIPPHPAAHGFARGSSVLSHARLHIGKGALLRFDLRSFFADVHSARAYGIFRTAGYPEEVSRTLLGLCTHRTPGAVLAQAPTAVTDAERHERFRLRQRLAAWHLPQGAPTSPALANLCAYALDLRLAALARSLGATYSRYADDLAFSGDAPLARSAAWLGALVEQIVRSEGFALNRRKTRVLSPGVQQCVTGVVVNAHPNVPRHEYDALKATLHNCARHGPQLQARGVPEFREHLRGRIAWVTQLNPPRGEKLLRLFEQIDWTRDAS